MGKISIDFRTGSLKTKKENIVGIDLGTTNSLIAYVENGQPKIIPVGENNSGIIPSVLFFEDNHIVVGEPAKQKMIDQPDLSLYSIKRLMGRTNDEIKEKRQILVYPLEENQVDELVKFKINQHSYSAIELSSVILKELKSQAEKILQSDIHQAVITVPAYFNDNQRQATRDAGILAGLEVLRIINEPTAASMAYGIGLNPEEHKKVMVYDFGGGTFDVSILRIENGIFEVIATQGDNFLGGDDIDVAIVQYWLNHLQLDSSVENMSELRLIAEQTKKNLSTTNKSSLKYNNLYLELSIEQLNKLAESIVDKTISCCLQALKDSLLTSSDIDEIILVGGSTRLSLVKEKLSATFKRPINNSINPDEVVALGAAIQADILAGNRTDLLLLDIAPLSLGIETLGGLMDTIIPRNSKIPLQLARNYTTSKDGQRKLKISVYQGEREMVSDNIKLAEFILHDLPPMAAGLPKIEVKFSIDADGILSVTAKELRSGIQQTIEIRSPHKLSEQEIAKRLQESTLFAEADMKKKAIIELTNESNYILANADKFLQQNKEHLKEKEIETIETAMHEIALCLQSGEKEKIDHAIHKFNESTAEIAHRIMDLQLKKSLGGSSIDNI
jgi:molecular chaperone HscA